MTKILYKVWLEIYKINYQNLDKEPFRYDGPGPAFETLDLDTAKAFVHTIETAHHFFVGRNMPPAKTRGAPYHLLRIEIETYEQRRDRYKTIVQVDLAASRSLKALNALRDKLQTVARTVAQVLPE